VTYELWDTETRNLVEACPTEGEALAAARELVELNAPTYPGALALVRVDEQGRMTTLARGEALAARIQDTESQRLPA